MIRSSLGFHTLTLSMQIPKKDTWYLVKDFYEYSKRDTNLKVFTVETNKTKPVIDSKSGLKFVPVENLKATFYPKDHGITWTIRRNEWNREFKSYFVEVTINPKILGGVNDYIRAADYCNDLLPAIESFNRQSRNISPLLFSFEAYSIKRIDYCVNFDIDELSSGYKPGGIPYNSEMVMALIRRGDIPPNYNEWKRYNETSHRSVGEPSSFYLMNRSVNINCYDKRFERQERSNEREENGLSAVPEISIESARNIIRFEIQCKYHKLYALSKKAEADGNHRINKYESLLTPDVCHSAITEYFKKVVGDGDWLTLQGAVRKIENCNFNSQKKARIIETLRLVNQCRSVSDAKAMCQGHALEVFKTSLRDLSELNINPVTIPKEWGVKRIRNLLDAYNDTITHEDTIKRLREYKETDREFARNKRRKHRK